MDVPQDILPPRLVPGHHVLDPDASLEECAIVAVWLETELASVGLCGGPRWEG